MVAERATMVEEGRSPGQLRLSEKTKTKQPQANRKMMLCGVCVVLAVLSREGRNNGASFPPLFVFSHHIIDT